MNILISSRWHTDAPAGLPGLATELRASVRLLPEREGLFPAGRPGLFPAGRPGLWPETLRGLRPPVLEGLLTDGRLPERLGRPTLDLRLSPD